MPSTPTQISTPHYALTVDPAAGQLALALGDGSDPLLISGWPLLLVPQIPGASLAPESVAVRSSTTAAGHPRLLLTARLTGSVTAEVTNEILCLPDRLVCLSRYEADADHALAHWHVAPAGSLLRGDAVYVYNGDAGQRENGQTLPLTGPVELTTASRNWLYNPMAPRVLLRCGYYTLALGGTTLAQDFGLELSTTGPRVEHFRFNYGGEAEPLPVAAHTPQPGPRLQIQVTLNLTPDQAQAAFTQAMVEDGIVTPRRYRPEEQAWRRPWYCTWGDQVSLAAGDSAPNRNAPADPTAVQAMLTPDLLLRAARLIREQDLNIGTLIIDDGWQDYRGDWNLRTDKFPDMRGLVETLHDLDFRVMLWWAPLVVEEGAAVNHRPDLVAGPLNRGQMVINYTSPATQAWVRAKLELWFGTAPGCWHLDGLKLDFLAEQIYPVAGGDPEWRGEERQMHHIWALAHGVMSKYHPAPAIWTAPHSPHLLPYMIALGTEERFDRDMSFLTPRPAMQQALCPGAWFSPHFNYHPDAIEAFCNQCWALGGLPQIGKLLTPEVTPDHLARLRQQLSRWPSPGGC